MERTSRLRRYQRKDYTQLIDFPVEIVGRDGQVRRYSFDESVRLYQRRIRSAAVRYDDLALVTAEVAHCRQRVEQLRRSYLEHFAWGPLRIGSESGRVRGALLAEVVAFLRRVFPSGEGPPPVDLTLLDGGEDDLWFVRFRPSGRTWLVYARPLDPERPELRASFRALARRLATMPSGPEVERLVATFEGPDVGLILTGAGEWDGPPPPAAGEDPLATFAADPDADPWLTGMLALQEGCVGDAVRAFELGLERAPTSLPLAQAAAVVALLDSQPERAEMLARRGLLAHPGDPRCRYLLGVALARLGRFREAEEALPAHPVDPRQVLLRSLLLIADWKLLTAAWTLFGPGAPKVAAERWVGRALGVVRSRVAAALVAVGIGLGIAAWAFLQPAASFAWIAGVLGVVVVGAAWNHARRFGLRTLTLGLSLPRLVSIELLPRARHDDAQ